jgi:hypothetical protein
MGKQKSSTYLVTQLKIDPILFGAQLNVAVNQLLMGFIVIILQLFQH